MDEHIYRCLFELQASTLMDTGFLTWEVEELDTKLGARCSIPGSLTFRSTGARVEFGTGKELKEKLGGAHTDVTKNSNTQFKVQDKSNKLRAYYILTPYNNRYRHLLISILLIFSKATADGVFVYTILETMLLGWTLPNSQRER